MTRVVDLPLTNTLANTDIVLVVTDPGGEFETTSKTTVSTLLSVGGAGFTNGQSISVNNFAVVGAFAANGSNGSSGQYLTANGTGGIYWSSPGAVSINVDAQYTWTNTQIFSNKRSRNKVWLNKSPDLIPKIVSNVPLRNFKFPFHVMFR